MRSNQIITCLLIILFILVLDADLSAQTRHRLVKQGNKLYDKGVFDQALAKYKRAEAKGSSPEISFNLGDALYKSGNHKGALPEFFKSLNTDDKTSQAKSFYNLGNAFFQTGEYDKAIAAYINSLRLKPDDLQTKQNLEYTLRMMQQQQQQQKQEQKDQDKQQKQQQDQQQQQQQQQQSQQQEKQEQPQNQPQPAQKIEMSKEDAEKILDALKNDEKAVQKKVLQRQLAGRRPKAKNW
jgi:tetratricopeptide (TPR) repeat protein